MIKSILVKKQLSFTSFLFYCFGLLTLISLTGMVNEYLALTFFFIYVVVSLCLFPLSAINILLFCVPFVLGDSKKEFFNFYDLLIVLVITSYLFNYLKEKRLKRVFMVDDLLSLFAVLFFVSSLISLPLDLRYFSYFIRTQPLNNIFASFLSANEGGPMFWVRILFNRITAVILFFIARDAFSERKLIKEHIKISGWQAFIIIPLAFLLFKDLIPHILYNFTTIQFVGALGITEGISAMTGLAYNPGYWGQYLVVFLPLIALWGIEGSKTEKFFSLLTIILTLISIPLTRQRGPILSLLIMCFFAVASYSYLKIKRIKRVLFYTAAVSTALFILLIACDLLLFSGFCTQRIFSRSFSTSFRGQIWQVAFRMFKDYKLSGIGIGKFHYFFPMFCQKAGIPWQGTLLYVRSTAHNIYFHLLAEQGLAGLLIFILFCFYAFMGVTSSAIQKNRAILFRAAIVAFLVFSFTQYMFYLRGMEILFWCYSGLIASLSSKKNKRIKCNSRKILVILICLGFLFILRLFDIFTFRLP